MSEGFPVLGDPPFREESRDEALAELLAAGISSECKVIKSREVEVLVRGSDAERMASAGIYVSSLVAAAPKERVTLYEVGAKAFGWKFHRAWYYWVADVADGKPIPRNQAEPLNATFRETVRVDGFAGGQDVRGPVRGYHVDTPEGLAALVALLKENTR